MVSPAERDFLIGLLIAIFTGVGMVSKEIDKRTLHAVLAKPLHRWEFLLGKFSGLVLTLTVNTAPWLPGSSRQCFVKHAIVGLEHCRTRSDLFYFTQMSLVVALAMLFSCLRRHCWRFCSPAVCYSQACFSRARNLQTTQLNPQTQKVPGISFLPSAELRKLRCDGRRGAREQHSGEFDPAQHTVHDSLLRHGS